LTKSNRRNATLTKRQLEVLKLVAEGKTNKEIGRVLRVQPATVKFHLNAIMVKLDARSRVHAVTIGFRVGILR
jgi:DNA-binding CsgD family transcriptional regulator